MLREISRKESFKDPESITEIETSRRKSMKNSENFNTQKVNASKGKISK